MRRRTCKPRNSGPVTRKAKGHALTGKSLSGREAAEIELINKAVPFEQLEAEVARQAQRLAGIPSSQLGR